MLLASVAVGLGSSHAAIGYSVGRVGRCAMRSMCRCLSCRVVNLQPAVAMCPGWPHLQMSLLLPLLYGGGGGALPFPLLLCV